VSNSAADQRDSALTCSNIPPLARERERKGEREKGRKGERKEERDRGKQGRQRRGARTNLFEFRLMRTLKHPITSNMIPHPPHIFLDPPKQLPIVHTHTLKQPHKVIRRIRAIRTSVIQARRRQRLGEKFLAGIGSVATTAFIGVAADVAVGVADVVEVFGFEFV
jgi:hypothetical protein